MAVNEGRLLGGQHPLTMCLEQALGCARRLCRRVECPAEMLARMAPPTARPWCDSISS